MWMTITGSKRLRAGLAGVLLAMAWNAHAGNAFDLLRQDPTPRGSALSSYPVAMAWAHLDALAINPAGLAGVEGKSASVAYADHPLDLSGGYVSVGQPFQKGFAAVSVTWFSYGDFDRQDAIDQQPTGSFSPSDMMLSAGYGRTLGYGISAGGAVRYLRSEIDSYSSSALSLDLGAMWREEVNDITIAATAANLGTQLSSFNETQETLPTTVRLAFAKELAHLPLQLNATAHYEFGDRFFATGGGEFTVSPLLKLRAGYSTLARDFAVGGPQDGTAGLTAGFGLTVRRLHLDYAFLSEGALGQVHRLGVGLAL